MRLQRKGLSDFVSAYSFLFITQLVFIFFFWGGGGGSDLGLGRVGGGGRSYVQAQASFRSF